MWLQPIDTFSLFFNILNTAVKFVGTRNRLIFVAQCRMTEASGLMISSAQSSIIFVVKFTASKPKNCLCHLLCTALQSLLASAGQHSTLGNIWWWYSYRPVQELQGDVAYPSKKQHLKKQNNIQIYYDFLNLFMHLVSFSLRPSKSPNSKTAFV